MKKSYITPNTFVSDFTTENILIQVGSNTSTYDSFSADSNIRGSRSLEEADDLLFE